MSLVWLYIPVYINIYLNLLNNENHVTSLYICTVGEQILQFWKSYYWNRTTLRIDQSLVNNNYCLHHSWYLSHHTILLEVLHDNPNTGSNCHKSCCISKIATFLECLSFGQVCELKLDTCFPNWNYSFNLYSWKLRNDPQKWP